MYKLMIRVLSSKAFFVFSMLLYRILIDLSYIYIISPNYSYSGLYLELNQFKTIESYLALLILSLILKCRIAKPSEFFIIFLFSMLVIPILSIYSLQDKSREFLYMVILSFLTIIIASKIKQIKVSIIYNGRKLALAISILTGFLLFSWIIVRGGLSYLNFDLLKVYEFRSTVGSTIFPGILSYAMTWFGKVINPLMIAFSLWKSNNVMIVFTIGVQVLFFAIVAHKAMLFYPLLIIFVYIFCNKRYFSQMVPLGLVGVTALSSILYILTDKLILISLFVRRVLYVTANNHYRYFDTFNELGYIYFSNKSWFPKIIEYPYDLPIPQLISYIYNGDTGTWVNTGFLATGYMNFGLVGMLIYSFIIGIIFRFIDYIAKRYLPVWLCIGIMIAPIFSLLSADLPTALVTHGILLAMIMLWLMSSCIVNNECAAKNNIKAIES